MNTQKILVLITFISLFSLTGCLTPQGDALKTRVINTATTAAISAFEDAFFTFCQAAPVGIVEAHFKDKPGLFMHYKKLCGHYID